MSLRNNYGNSGRGPADLTEVFSNAEDYAGDPFFKRKAKLSGYEALEKAVGELDHKKKPTLAKGNGKVSETYSDTPESEEDDPNYLQEELSARRDVMAAAAIDPSEVLTPYDPVEIAEAVEFRKALGFRKDYFSDALYWELEPGVIEEQEGDEKVEVDSLDYALGIHSSDRRLEATILEEVDRLSLRTRKP